MLLSAPAEGWAIMHRIFIVEDHPAMRGAYITLIAPQPDMEIIGEAASGEEALKRIPGCGPDLVMIDISLPGMSGIELLRCLQKQRPELPALIVSGHQEISYIDHILSLGARGYVMKHQGPNAILEAIRQIMSGEIYVASPDDEEALDS
jgi:DNA-binding NarL/FixJ family response regulator